MFIEKKDSKPKKQYVQSPFKKGIHKCKVCGKKSDWHCRITEDEGLALCKNIPSKYGQDKNGRYKHRLKTDEKSSIAKSYSNKDNGNDLPQNTDTPKANAIDLDKVYCALIENCKLEDSHRKLK